MRITDLTITLVAWQTPPTSYGHALTFGGDKELGVLTLHTDAGVEGHAFLGSAARSAADDAGPLLTYLKPLVLGQNPLDIGRLWQAMWQRNRAVSLRAIGAVDVALWDLAGKVMGQPVHRLLGTCRERVPAYASSARLESPEAYAEEALAYRAHGWTAYKIHPHGDPRADLAICRAVRKAVGDDYTLMLDSVWSYGYEDALRVGRAIEELGFFWYEDPLPEDDIYGYVKLCRKLDIPVLATEYAPGGLYGMTQWVLQGATDMLRGDVALKGGITALVKIAHLAEAFRMKCEIHHGGNSLNNVANLHVTMAVPNCDYFEVLLPDAVQKYGLVEDITVDGEGYVHAPTAPGLGYAIDWELVRRRTTRVLR